MFFRCERLILRSTAPIQFLDVTARIRRLFEDNRFLNGQVTVYSPHTTAFVTLNEKEPMLQRDMVEFLGQFVPPDPDFGHNQDPVDGRLNAHSHLIGLFMNASETIPVADGQLLLGGWQSIFFVELDGPREERTLRVQLAGEG